jgi:hypothetical protein
MAIVAVSRSLLASKGGSDVNVIHYNVAATEPPTGAVQIDSYLISRRSKHSTVRHITHLY